MNTQSSFRPFATRRTHGRMAFTPLIRRPVLLAASAFALLAAVGCVSEPGPHRPVDTTKFTLENTDKFLVQDAQVRNSVTCTGLQERALADGRLQVVANVKNRENRRIQVQVNCVFKDDQGFSTGDEAPWQNLILGEYETQAVQFAAMNTAAKKYTIHVRQAR